ncbi:hypothetical protein M408DRAFT_282468 [Serendipita vermifera MAFF 305830]|uniref:Protein kinase domain-containing protein n=1 Tax=Serendipita vermifera MAFF 305830 TaxID=933852 RepID=A0A0C2W8C1_SERVB|nr:hypothetical protein M408DRAFT_282468 [Serendipita vermifera MAFF 305830]
MPSQIERLEKIKRTLEDHWAMVRDAQTWPGYRQGQAPPEAVVDQASSSIKGYLMQVELILEELWSLGGSSEETGPTVVQASYVISEEDVARYSEDLNSSFQWLERLLLYMKSDAQMRSTEADLFKAIEEQTAAMQSFSIKESSGTVTLTAWPWVDENSEARFPSSRPSRAQLVEPQDLSDAISHKSTLPKYAGPYSLVYTGEYEGTTVAIKVLQSPGVTTHAMRRKARRERLVWASLNHPNILPLYGYAEDDERFGQFGALISPWYRYGDATSFIRDYGNVMDATIRIKLWEDVVAGVWYLHSQSPSIIHGDLKPENVLIDEEGRARLSDFGLVRLFSDQEDNDGDMNTTSPHTGTTRYLAYELVAGEDVLLPTTSSDIWALACVGLVIIFNQLPYGNRRSTRSNLIVRDICDRVLPAQRPLPSARQSIAPEQVVWDLLERCWDLDPSARLTSHQLADYLSGRSNMFQVGRVT